MMKIKMVLVFTFIALTLALSACAPAASGDAMSEEPTEAMMTETMTEPAMTQAMTEDAMLNESATPEAMMDAPAWFGESLTDVNTGTVFTINDFHGKVVLVEMMAQWCPTCKRQQNEIKSLHAQMAANPDLVTVSLDIDPNEDAETLKTYTASNGFDWLYAVPSEDAAREIGNLYGAQFLNPPSAPMLIIDRKGEAHPLPFGVKSAADLMTALESFLNSGM